jgi:hypothetical protein
LKIVVRKRILSRLAAGALTICCFVLSSCFGLESDIVINSDGSGTACFQYRISRQLDDMGRQGGDADNPTANTDEEAWRKTVSGLSGLSLVSYKSRYDDKDHIVTVNLKYDKLETLAALMGGKQNAMTLSKAGKQEIIFWKLGLPKTDQQDSSLLNLVQDQFKGYMFSGTFTVPNSASLSLVDGTGRSQPCPDGWVLKNGKKANFSIPMASLLQNSGRNLSLKLVFMNK